MANGEACHFALKVFHHVSLAAATILSKSKNDKQDTDCGTVARTQRIPVAQRAESAVIAWLRHQTTAYDNVTIARVKGKRREVRRMLANESRRLLQKYRDGQAIDPTCPLQQALSNQATADRD